MYPLFQSRIQHLTHFNSRLYRRTPGKMWIGPGEAFRCLRELNQEKLNEVQSKGLTFDTMIEAHAEGDDAIVATVPLFLFRPLFSLPRDLKQLMLLNYL
jgi:hypothetical protein